MVVGSLVLEWLVEIESVAGDQQSVGAARFSQSLSRLPILPTAQATAQAASSLPRLPHRSTSMSAKNNPDLHGGTEPISGTFAYKRYL